MYRLICQKPAHFLSAQMALVSTVFQMFIVLGMYNFVANTGLWAIWAKQHAPYTRFLTGPARKEINFLSKLKSTS